MLNTEPITAVPRIREGCQRNLCDPLAEPSTNWLRSVKRRRSQMDPPTPSARQSRGPATPLMVALDIDGTLCPDGSTDRDAHRTISTAVRDAIATVLRCGAHLVLCTGRLAPATTPFLRELNAHSGYAVCSNGAVVVDAQTGAALHKTLFDLAEVVFDLRARLPGAVFVAEDPAVGVRITGPVSDVDRLFGRVRWVDPALLIREPTTRLAVHWPGHSPAELATALADFSVVGVRFWLDPGDTFADLTAAGVSKASALETLRIELEVPADRTLAIGDGVNDLEMLRWAGWSVAMGQAPAVVRAAANEVCPPVTEDGLATALAWWFG